MTLMVAGILNNLGRESRGSTSALLEGDQIDFSKALQEKINIYRVFSIIGMSLAFILLMVLKMKDYKKILDYLKVALHSLCKKHSLIREEANSGLH